MKFDRKGIEEDEETICALSRMVLYPYAPKNIELDLANWPTPPAKPSIEEPPLLGLKKLPRYLRYVFVGHGNTLPIIIAADLGDKQVEALILILQMYKRAIG